MPFTVSHVAAVLPMRAIGGPLRRLPMSGLAAGAMSPDLVYLVRGFERGVSHSAAGIVVLDLPLALGALLVARFVAPGLASVLPQRWPGAADRVRTWSPPWHSPAAIAWLVAAIVLGAANHIVVDAFTHGSSAGVRWFPVLAEGLGVWGIWLPVYRWLQYGLSLVGLGVLVALAGQRLRELERPPARRDVRPIPKDYLGLALVVAGIAGVSVLLTPEWALMSGVDRDSVVEVTLATCRGAVVVLGALGVSVRAVALKPN